jgi:hypothetical protein
MNSILRGLHLLAARAHLDLAGVRMLTDEEFWLLEDVAGWWESRRA